MSEAYQKTFQWVFEPKAIDGSTPRWDGIVQWFERGNGIYWISGKAGSGKSTLMNYICQEGRSLDHLKVWSGTKEVFTPTFFFWNAGTPMEKSTEGLLRSVLYQILKRFPALTTQAYDERSALSLEQSSIGHTLAWTERRLLKAFHNLVPQVQKKCRICIFIDGLDEVGGESDAAIEVVKSLLSADLKVCLSSRPDVAYTDAFDSCQKLRLQDLTQLDIKTYSRDRLLPHLQTNTQEDVSKLIDDIARRAQGVFLWVDLVVKAMIKGLKNHDSVEQLRIRVDSTPSDIEALYAEMLINVDVAYREEAAQLFHMALAGLSNSLLNVSLTLYNVFERQSELSIQEALHLCHHTRRRLPAVCGGLLEVDLEDRDSEKGKGTLRPHDGHVTLPCDHADSMESADIFYQERYAHVRFIHRTAMDFLRQTKDGRHFLEHNTVSGFSLRSNYVRGLLAKVNLFGFPEKPRNIIPNYYLMHESMYPDDYDFGDAVAQALVFDIMRNISQEEWQSETAQRSLCDDVDRTLATAYEKRSLSSPLLHWSARWGRHDGESDLFIGGFGWPRWTSRSTSPDSFRSARTEPTLCSNVPCDFLGFAATWGLYIYVLEVIDSREQHLDKEYASYLIWCLMSPLRFWQFVTDHQEGFSATLDLITELLSRGGNPNMYAGHLPTTIWGQFLHELPRNVLHAPTAFTRTMEAFLESGANINIKAPLVVEIRVSGHSQAAPGSPRLYFRHERSALYIIRRWLKHTPELRSVERIILAKGGLETHATTFVALKRDEYRPCRVPQNLQIKLVSALDEAHNGFPNIWDRGPSVFQNVRRPEQLANIYKEILETCLESENSASSDEDDASDHGAKEGSFEPYELFSVQVEDMQQ